MKIYGSLFDPLRPDRSGPAPSSSPSGKPADPVAPAAPPSPSPSRDDSVQFSATGRSLANRLAADSASTFAPERVAELRRKVLEGAYHSLDVVDQVARRILTRGDL